MTRLRQTARHARKVARTSSRAKKGTKRSGPPKRGSQPKARTAAASRQNVPRVRQPVASLFGRRLTPPPEPRT